MNLTDPVAWGAAACAAMAIIGWPRSDRLMCTLSALLRPRPVDSSVHGRSLLGGSGAGIGRSAGGGRARWWSKTTSAALDADPPDEIDVAATLDLVALALRTGCGVVEAVGDVARGSPERVSHQLSTVVAGVGWGLGWSRAWALVPDVWAPARRAMVLAAEAGASPADPLVRAADGLREARSRRLELNAARLGVRIVLPLGMVFLPAFVMLTVVPLVLALAGEVM